MISIEVAVKASKRLESLLEARFGATGRGLHEKLTSVEAQIPEDLRRSIRWVATIRNKVVHEEGDSDADATDFRRTVDRIVAALTPEPRPRVRVRSRSAAEAPADKKRVAKSAAGRARRSANPKPRKPSRRARAVRGSSRRDARRFPGAAATIRVAVLAAAAAGLGLWLWSSVGR